MANIVLKDRNGANVVYKNIDYLSVKTEEGDYVRFSESDLKVSSVDQLPTENIDPDILYSVIGVDEETGEKKVTYCKYTEGGWQMYLVPSGTLDLEHGGVFNVAEYAEVRVTAGQQVYPIFVDSVEEMTDTSSAYVLNSTGEIYKYDDVTVSLVDTIKATKDNPYWLGWQLNLGDGELKYANETGFVTPFIDLTKYTEDVKLKFTSSGPVIAGYGNSQLCMGCYNENKELLQVI
jgi:hypothetical protein